MEEGIDSISLNPDAVIATRLEVARIEASLAGAANRISQPIRRSDGPWLG